MSIPNFPNIRQVHSTICWAACIEMVARFLNPEGSFENIPRADLPLQRRILKHYYGLDGSVDNSEEDMLNTFCEIGDGYPTLSHDDNYYQKILLEVFKIRSVQKFQDNIPTFSFLKRNTDARKPVILGLKYPGILNGNHAVVVISCVKRQDVKLLHIVDPFSNHTSANICVSGPGKIAYMSYSYLRNLNRSDPSLVSVVCNFEKIAIASLMASPPEPTPIEFSGLQNTGGIEDIRNMVMGLFLDESIFRVKLEELKMREAVITSRFQSLRQFLDEEPFQELKLLKVLTSKKDSLEIMIAETPATGNEPASYEFVGIRESYFTDQNISNVKLRFKEKNTGWHVNHFEPNYTLLHLQPGNLTFMVFTQEGEKCYVSLSEMPSIGIHYREPYSFADLKKIIRKHFPRYIAYETAK
ncbi:hypothetical protein [Dyadobacter sp. CY326]|uniref:hypothetical protein n=1 Tax=Dyadobacter sp. CY326 TaxID=2907300 RepID=UPI001F4011BC|nr:hypothetical protein [Dyadobacter sp. CY326]MCE7064618.1 hypothetical protein [Dyadobacter sp. CY326]